MCVTWLIGIWLCHGSRCVLLTATPCNTLQHPATPCNTLQHTLFYFALWASHHVMWNATQYEQTATRCITLQTHCKHTTNTLQTHCKQCNTLQHTLPYFCFTCRHVIQNSTNYKHTASHCKHTTNTLPKYCNTLQQRVGLLLPYEPPCDVEFHRNQHGFKSMCVRERNVCVCERVSELERERERERERRVFDRNQHGFKSMCVRERKYLCVCVW